MGDSIFTRLRACCGDHIGTFLCQLPSGLEDSAHGKNTLLVRLGTKRAANLVPWFIILSLFLEWIPIINGKWPITALLGACSIPSAIGLTKLLKRYHNKPEMISESKFLALRFQTINGIGLSIGLALKSLL